MRTYLDVVPQVVSMFIIQIVPQVDQDTLANVYTLALEISTHLMDHPFNTQGMPCQAQSGVTPHPGSYNMIPKYGLPSYLDSHYTNAS